ncbi:hypothetical protein DPSP01_001981 [Paraphaeosphaeria sporulosa]
MRLQTESGKKSRESVTEHWHTEDVKDESATAGAQEANDTEAQPKKVNFDIPDVLPPRDDLSRNERCADLRKFIDYLQGINSQNPHTCILDDDFGPCDYPIARRYRKDHPGKSKDAAEVLIRDADLVLKDDFIKVVRTYFCGTHDFSMKSGRKAFRNHFLKLWEETSDKFQLRAEVWDALRKCERNLYPYGPSTPQQERPHMNRAANSVPKEVPRPSETMTPSLDSTVESPTRPWTAQGNLNQDSKLSRFNPDLTPSKLARPTTRSPMGIAAKSKTDPSDINSGDNPKRTLKPNEMELLDPASSSRMQPFSQSKTTFSGSASGLAAKPSLSRETLFKPHTGPESSLVDKKMLWHDLPDPFQDKKPTSEARQSSLSNEKVTGSSKMPESTYIKPRIESSLEGTDPSIQDRPKSEPRRSPLFDLEAPGTSKAPIWWPKTDEDLIPRLPPSEKSPEETFMPFRGKSIFDKLGEARNNANNDGLRIQKNSTVIPKLTPPPRESRETASRSITPDVQIQLRGARTDSCEMPVKPNSDPNSSTPKLFTPVRNLQDMSNRTAVSRVDAYTSQTPTVSREHSTERASILNAPNEGTLLENLSNELEDLEIASPFLETPLFQEDSRSRSSSPSPQGAVQSSCVFPPRNATSTARNIKKILKKEITGSIYVLEAPEFFLNHFGPSRDREEIWCKIGIAADVDERVKEIRSTCGISDLKEVYSTEPNIRYDVLKVIEEICHAQLNNSRRYLDCRRYGVSPKCVTRHKEWFAVPNKKAIRTVRMWKAFLDHNPYGHDGVLDERWSKSLKKDYPLLEHDGNLDQDDLLHQSLEAWIEKTGEDQG